MKNSVHDLILQRLKITGGFTLVELLIFFGLTSIFLTVLTDLFVAIFDVKRESEATSAVDQDGRFIIERLIYDVSRSSVITTPATFGGTASSLVMTIGGSAYTYGLSGSTLNLTNNSGVMRVNSSQTTVSNLAFVRIGDEVGNETIRASFTLSSVLARNSGSEVRNFQTTIGRR